MNLSTGFINVQNRHNYFDIFEATSEFHTTANGIMS